MAFGELKARHSVAWGNGPYERVTNTIRDIHALVVERVDPKAGERVLDAATGTGAVAILVALRGVDVVGQDLAPVLIETARQRAAEEGVEVDFQVGDAEAMVFDDASFDVVLSTCGVMFAPDHDAIAGELSRVTRPGGRLALACWQPKTGMHDVFKMMGPYLPPPAPGAGSPFAWGDRGARGRAARRHVRAGIRGARLATDTRRRRGVLGALLHVLRADEDCHRGIGAGPPGGVPPSVGRVLETLVARVTRWFTTASTCSRSASVAESPPSTTE